METWLTEDPELLRVALDIVDTWDESASHIGENLLNSLSFDISVTQEKTPNEPTSVKPNGKRKLQPSTMASTHHRRRREIQDLQNLIVDLTHEIESLEKRKKRQLEESQQYDEGNRRRIRLWRDIALRQQHLRTIAESEQRMLHQRIDAQMKVVQGLIKLAEKARKLEEEETARSRKRHQRLASSRLGLVEKVGSLDTIPLNLDTIGIDTIMGDDEKVTSIKLLQHQNKQFEIELGAAWTVPFEQGAVLNAIWKCLFKRHDDAWCAPTFAVNATFTIRDHEVVSEFTAAVQIESFKGNCDGRTIVKRYPGTCSTPPLVVADLISGPSPSAPGDFAGVRGREGICIAVLPASLGTHSPQASRIQLTERVTIMFEDDTSCQQAELMTNVMLTKVRERLEIIQETVETLLLTEPLQ